MNTERPRDMGEHEAQTWLQCVSVVLEEEAEAREQDARKHRERTIALLARARQIVAAERQVPPLPIHSGAIGRDLIRGLAWFAANVEAGIHVSVDRDARPAFERLLLEHERVKPDTAEIDWWHALDRHSFNLDDERGCCTCGQSVGGFLTLSEVHHRAREKYDAAMRMPSRGSRWSGTR